MLVLKKSAYESAKHIIGSVIVVAIGELLSLERGPLSYLSDRNSWGRGILK